MCMDQNAVSGTSGKSRLFAAVKLHSTRDVGAQNLLFFVTAWYGLFFMFSEG